MNSKINIWLIVLLIASLVGIIDAGYLTWEHYQTAPPPCHVNWVNQLFNGMVDCGQVLKSKYAQIGPIPVASLGLVFYGSVMGWVLVEMLKKTNKINEILQTIKLNKTIKQQVLFFIETKWWYRLLGLMAVAGIATSSVLIYLMVSVIKAICLYCVVSAANTVVIAISTWRWWSTYKQEVDSTSQ